MTEWISTPQSSNISRFKYDSRIQTLTIEFNNGSVYDYYDIPESIYKGMQSAESKGSYLATNIKKKYRYARK